jgi:hypothetical protein
MFIASTAIIIVLLCATGVIHASDRFVSIVIIVGVIAFIVGGFIENEKDEAARRNARDYWLNRGSGVRDRRTCDDRYKRRR